MISADLTRFTRPKFDVLGDCGPKLGVDAIQSLPDLILFNARENPNHTFCLQAESNTEVDESNATPEPFSLLPVTFRQLAGAIHVCAATLRKSVPERCLLSRGEGDNECALAPVALLLESNVGLFIYLATLLSMQIPVSKTCLFRETQLTFRPGGPSVC